MGNIMDGSMSDMTSESGFDALESTPNVLPMFGSATQEVMNADHEAVNDKDRVILELIQGADLTLMNVRAGDTSLKDLDEQRIKAIVAFLRDELSESGRRVFDAAQMDRAKRAAQRVGVRALQL